MKLLLIIYLILPIAYFSCLGRTARSGGALSQLTPEDYTVLGEGPDLNGNGMPDIVERDIKEKYGLGPNEPINNDILRDYLESKKAESQLALATTWKPEDISKMTGISLQAIVSGLSAYWSTRGISQADINKVGLSVAPVKIGNLVEKDIEILRKETVRYTTTTTNDGESAYITFNQAVQTQPLAAFEWKAKNSRVSTRGSYTVMISPNNGGGYILFSYGDGRSALFNGFYTTNVERCCWNNENTSTKWVGNNDGSISNIQDYIITKVQLIGQTSSGIINETYIRDNAEGACEACNCSQ